MAKNLFLISYDLKVPNRDYATLIDTIKTAPGWWHHLESTWLIATNEGLSDWVTKIRKVIDENDHFIIVDIKGKDRNGWLPKSAWDWWKGNS